MEKNIVIIGVLVVILFLFGFITAPPKISLGFVLTIGLFSFFLTFINLRLGLFLLIFMIPLSTQFKLGAVGTGAIEVATDDIAILGVIVAWLGYLGLTKEPLFKRTALNMPFLGFFLISLISLLLLSFRTSQNVLSICLLHLIKWFEYVIIYYIVISVIKNKEELKFYTLTFMISCVFVALSQVGLAMTGHISSAYELGRTRAFATVPFGFDSTSVVAAYYLFFLSIILAMVLKVAKGFFKLFLSGICILISYTLFTSFSRAGYLAIIVVCIILGFILDRRLLALVLVLITLTPIFLPAVTQRIAITATRVGERIELDASSLARLGLWNIALKKFVEQPLLGFGFWASRYEVFRTTAHNQLLTVLLETGILGFLFFFLIFYRIFKIAVFNYRNTTDIFIKSLNMGYIAGVAGLIVQSMFGEILESGRVTGPLWFMTGIIVLINQFLKDELKINESK